MPCCSLHPRVASPEDSERELDGDPLDWLPSGQLERLSGVASFYEGASVFLTGATGFIGSLVLEKLLRSCPGLSTVYVLVRDKKGVPLQERLRSHLDKVVFSRAREECPDYLSKVVPIAGDLTQPGLGISPADAAELTSKVSVVFHVGATVRFDADLRTAAVTNVTSTCEVIALVKRMPRLKAFVYMSTAYSHAPRNEIDEKFYTPPLTAKELLKLISVLDDEQLGQILPTVQGDWPNTYTYTKAIAEDLVRTDTAGLPVSIIRPSIVTCTYREPLAFWVGNMYGPSGLGAGGAIGLLHALHIDGDALLDYVPADIVSNATVVCAWDTWCRHNSQTLTQRASAEPLIYNCVSTPRHPIRWANVERFVHEGTNYPSIRNLWYSCMIACKQRWLYSILAVLFHLLPALIADTFLHLKGMKPILWDLYGRIHGVSQAVEPFTTREWAFRDDNLASMLGRMGAADRKLFPCDITEVDLECLYRSVWRGIRFYIFKESYDNLEAARKKYRRLMVLHWSLVTVGCALLLLMLWRIVADVTGL